MGIVTCFSSSVRKLLFLSNPRRRWWASKSAHSLWPPAPGDGTLGAAAFLGLCPSLLLRTEATAERGSSSSPQCSFSLGWVSPSQGTSRLDSFTASSLPPFFREGPTGCLERGSKRPPLLAFGQNLLGVLSFSACADILLSFPFPRVVAKGKTLSGGSSTRARAASHPTDHADFPTTLFSPFSLLLLFYTLGEAWRIL